MVAPVTSIIENNAKIPTHAPTQTPSSSWFRPVSAIEEVMVSFLPGAEGPKAQGRRAKTPASTRR